jgi:probable addiction module antidote protein
MVKTYPYDSAELLTSREAISAYLALAFESDDPAVISHAMGVVARAKGMTDIAKKAGLTRESLYKALSAEGNPEFATVLKVLRALDLKIVTKAA